MPTIQYTKSPAFFGSVSALSFFEEDFDSDIVAERLEADSSISSELDAILAK